MAIYHLQINTVSRSAGRSATAAAAYRAGERIRDVRSGELHNHSRRTDVLHKEILLPSQLQGKAPAWATDRQALWNAAEQFETRRNARTAREYQVALPPELDQTQRRELALRFAHEMADRHQVVVDLAVHAPRAGGDPRNHHAHLLVSTRELTADGWGGKAGLDMSSAERSRRGLPLGIIEMKAIRARWAEVANEALAAAGVDARIDHRSWADRGINREPRPVLPIAVAHQERRAPSELGDYLRAQYEMRVQARQEQTRAAAEQAPTVTASLEQARAQARETWLALRRERTAAPATESQPATDLKTDWAL